MVFVINLGVPPLLFAHENPAANGPIVAGSGGGEFGGGK
jgi:hypothetical protein